MDSNATTQMDSNATTHAELSQLVRDLNECLVEDPGNQDWIDALEHALEELRILDVGATAQQGGSQIECMDREYTRLNGRERQARQRRELREKFDAHIIGGDGLLKLEPTACKSILNEMGVDLEGANLDQAVQRFGDIDARGCTYLDFEAFYRMWVFLGGEHLQEPTHEPPLDLGALEREREDALYDVPAPRGLCCVAGLSLPYAPGELDMEHVVAAVLEAEQLAAQFSTGDSVMRA